LSGTIKKDENIIIGLGSWQTSDTDSDETDITAGDQSVSAGGGGGGCFIKALAF